MSEAMVASRIVLYRGVRKTVVAGVKCMPRGS